jgi:glutaconate CoA-transferase, subunit A
MDTPAPRASRIVSAGEAVGQVRDGMTIAIGGFINTSHPMEVVREIIRRGRRDLRVVGAASSGLEIDLLIAAGCVREVVAPYVGAETLASIGPAYRTAVQSGAVEVFELDEAMYYAGLRAAAQRVPFNPWVAGLGTSFPQLNPAIKVFDDPVSGRPCLAIPAIGIDIAFLHAARADAYGNVQYEGTGFGDRAIWAAADRTFVQVERVVSNEEIRRRPQDTAIPGADGVIRAPFGSHPYASPGCYLEDREHIAAYVAAATRWLKEGDRRALDEYLERFVTGPADLADYLERVGMRKLLSLDEY